ncbi:MAG: polysaccharide biosynthesis protein [Lutibacter sp.]|uniref:polysaccharide biosynthesis protein n=1 Tax=Lutibacter sp. TaxID=1925666 RepID=UPI0017F0F3B1|nr:nucleoside-diphosphate sugar epimerase/dehydratase [Lutibacter sp.]MBT8318243.1 polysaccharide biosynthesis protein [Lutibacter sp.]NNJ59102.1 polysaccharide biosynthesis protein [Lutibacter sp.]
MILRLFKKIARRNIPRWIVLLIDIYIVINTFVLSYLIRFNFSFTFDTSKLLLQIPLVIVAALIAFVLVGSYKGIIRHTGFKDSMNVSIASFIILALLGGVVIVNKYASIQSNFTIPRSILVIHFLLNVLVLIFSRYLFKEVYYYVMSGFEVHKKVIIYGAGEAGMLVYSLLTNDKKINSNVIAFIDDDKRKARKKMNGILVYDAAQIDEDFILDKQVDEIIISIQNIRPSRLLEIVDRLSKLPSKVKIVPPVQSWMDGNLNPKQIQAVKIEDLLGRQPISLNNPTLQKEFENKVILVTGAAGSIGSEIIRQISTFNVKNLILVDQAESDLYNLQQSFIHKQVGNITAIVADIRNATRMEGLIKEYQPAIIFHAAAYKHVPFMEDNPSEALNTNVVGTKILVDLALQYQVEKFVFISTDKAVNPTNIMGASKRVAEMYINFNNDKGSTKFITTRFGNVLGSNGSVIPLFQSQIKRGGPITVTHKDITRYFMTIPEACQLVLEAGCMGKGGEIFVFDMGDSIKIFDLALNMIRLSGFNFPADIDIKIIGLRPGEKIYEELLCDGENTQTTYHDKIMIAKVKKMDFEKTNHKIEELCALHETLNFEDIVLRMKKIVPEFISNNSKYEVLDN